MQVQPPSRTVRPDAEAIKRLRLAKGWSVEVLADKAICSVKTLRNIEKGESVYLSTLSKIATALCVDFATLMPDGKPPSDPPLGPESRIQVQITVSIPFAQFDESKQLCGLIDSFRQFLAGGGGDIRVLNVGSGSTVITLEMTHQDILALRSAYSEGKLAKLHCIDLRTKFEHDADILDPDQFADEELIPRTNIDSRTVRPDADAIKRLRLQKGWRVEDLAAKAICTVKTVENVERGVKVYLFTLGKLAKELGVEVMSLVQGNAASAKRPKPKPSVKLNFVVSIPFDQFDESEQLNDFIHSLAQFMRHGRNLDVLSVAPGNNTTITVEMSVGDLHALTTAYAHGQLVHLLCDEIRIDCKSLPTLYERPRPASGESAPEPDDTPTDDIPETQSSARERRTK